MQRRRINRGPRKADIEVTPQYVEDLIDKRVGSALEALGVLSVKYLFQQQQLLVAARLLQRVQDDLDSGGANTRELLGTMASMLSGVFGDLIPVESPEDYAALSLEDIEEYLERHFATYGISLTDIDEEYDEPDEYEDDEVEDAAPPMDRARVDAALRRVRAIRTREAIDRLANHDVDEEYEGPPAELTIEQAARLAARVRRAERQAYRRAGIPLPDTDEQPPDEEDIISAVSDEVQEDFGAPRRRRRRS